MNSIRKATEEDIDWLVDIGIKDMFSLYTHPEIYDPVYLKSTFIPYLIKNGIVLVVEECAAFIGIISGHPFNPNVLVATELMWWVKEEKRNSSIGYKLLKFFENEAEKNKCSFVSLSLMPCSPIHSLEKHGYSIKEYSLIKEI